MFKYLAALLVFLTLGCVDPQTTYKSDNVKIHAAMKMLWRDNPESLQILKDVHLARGLHKPVHLSIRMGDLPGATLATTVVNPEGAYITVDVDKVAEVHDHLVPVLAHEIYHVKDAFLVYGPEKFMDIVAKEHDLGWSGRTLEISAIKAENALRRKLLDSDKPGYSGMAISREEANRRASVFAQLHP